MTTPLQNKVETARYKIFLNKSDGKHVVVFQFPHLERDRPFKEQSKPLEIRLKPKSGLVEVDVPLADVSHVNKRLAVQYGQAINQHKTATAGAPIGIAGGFGSLGSSGVKRQEVDMEREDALVADFDRSLRVGKALNVSTLRGQIQPFDPAEPAYYMGGFKGDELHLTKISAFCSLGVGLHHLDAIDLNEKARRRAAQQEDAPAERAAIVGMQVKNAEEIKTEESEWKRVLRELQEEPWQKLDWIDDYEEQSFDIFHERLFLDEKNKPNRISAIISQEQYADTLTAVRGREVMKKFRIKRDGTRVEDDNTDTESSDDDYDVNQPLGF